MYGVGSTRAVGVAVATGVGVPVAVGRGVIVALGVAVSISIRAVTGIDGAEVAVLVWVVEAVADSATWDELFAGKDGVATGRVPGADVVPSAPEIGRQAISAAIARYTHNNLCMSKLFGSTFKRFLQFTSEHLLALS